MHVCACAPCISLFVASLPGRDDGSVVVSSFLVLCGQAHAYLDAVCVLSSFFF